MDSEMIPATKAVKKALEKQEEEIAREQEDEVASPSEVAAMKRRLKREMRKLGRKPKKSSLFFGPGTRRKSRARKAMNAAREAVENADFAEAIAVENARIQAENAAAAAAAAPVAAAPAAAPAAAHNAQMNALANMLSGTHIGPVRHLENGRNPFTRNGVASRGVPGYHFKEEGGRRRTRRKRARSRRSRH